MDGTDFAGGLVAPIFANDPQLKAFTDMLPYARFAPPVANWEQMVDAVIAAVQKTYIGQAQPEAALTEAAATIDGLIQQ